jgi:hypothetical protein
MSRFAAFALSALLAAATVFSQPVLAEVQNPAAKPAAPVNAPINENNLVPLTGNTHRLARAEFDRGPVDRSRPLDRLVLVLKRSPAQDAALLSKIDGLYDPASPDFHKWVHAKEFGQTYGVSDQDIARVTAWLESHGMKVTHVSNGRTQLEFSATVGQVNDAFHVEMRSYQVRGENHIANDRDPSIPAALTSIVGGVLSLNDFYPMPKPRQLPLVKRDPKTGSFRRVIPSSSTNPNAPKSDVTFTDPNGIEQEYVTPADFAVIYNTKPLLSAGINGAGVTIAIAGTSDIDPADVASFQSQFGLANKPITTIVNGTDPGYNGARNENSMDVELSGGAAPGASIVLVVSGTQGTTPTFILSDEYIIDNEVAPIMSTSYGGCELDFGASGNQAINSIWQQAASEGISSFVSSGDSGSDSCDSQDPRPNAATSGLGVSGLASTPYATAVGGTDFFWQNDPTEYFSATNNPTTGESALGYVPEIPWNSTCSSPTVASYFGYTDTEQFCNDAINDSTYDVLVLLNSGNGGVSACTAPTGSTPNTCAGGYAKPTWQTGTGVPKDGKRDVPDVSLLGSGGTFMVPGSGYLICDSEYGYACNPGDAVYEEDGGTSASSPSMAGVMALVLQKVGSAQGLANPVLYKLFGTETASNCSAATVTNSGSCIFNDIVANTNAQVCENGSPNCDVGTAGDEFGILSGYNSTTGYDLTTGLGSVNAYNLATAWAKLTTKVATTTTLTVSPNPAGINANVTFTATVKKSSGSGTPTGSVTFTVNGTTLTAVALTNGVATVSGVQFADAGTYAIVAQYAGDSSDNASTSTTVNLVVGSAASATTTTLKASPNPVTVNANVTLTATVKKTSGSGTPTGSVTFYYGTDALGTINLNGSGVATLTAKAAVPAGKYPITATYNGDAGDKPSTSAAVTITVNNPTKTATTTTATASPNPVKANANVTLTAKVTGGATPTGSVSFSSGTLALGSATLSAGSAHISAKAAVPTGSYPVTVTYSGDTTHAGSTGSVVVKVD